jgi:hypothetical protein
MVAGPSGPRDYTRQVPAERIAENLAYINWTVLMSLALGSLAAVVLAHHRTGATRGFLAFTAICATAFGALALASDLGLATASAFDLPRRIALGAFVAIAGAYTIALVRSRRAPALALAGLGAGLATDALAALGWGPDPLAAVPLLLQLLVLGAATGGVFAAMILGHWYLVSPKLPEAPLVLFSRLLLGVLLFQLALFITWVGLGTGATSGPFSALVGPWAFFVWLRLLVGLVFPIIVSWAAIQTARSRSMESATGLLYINVGTIAAGTILAAGLYFGAGLLV